MKKQLNYFYVSILFIGMTCSCFQFTIIQFSKSKKEIVSNFAEEDADDTEDNTEEETEKNTENEKKELRSEFLIQDFNHSFYKTQNTKTALYIHRLQSLNPPDLEIYTPPPKNRI